jgi:hypothetical protein
VSDWLRAWAAFEEKIGRACGYHRNLSLSVERALDAKKFTTSEALAELRSIGDEITGGCPECAPGSPT